ncbi:DUF4082 domain-containing protein [Bradyrhizobium sp. 150]|uniref:DUF4082 domain-containing protein n=1 Tax=Bradyrhizobium sp. 150 TaxID=2782625 RepID=UPI001FFB9054|nr:DUF4082 domain-containing protein [Bradyrhizobium sp. 150]
MLNQRSSVFYRGARPLLPEESDFNPTIPSLERPPFWAATWSNNLPVWQPLWIPSRAGLPVGSSNVGTEASVVAGPGASSRQLTAIGGVLSYAAAALQTTLSAQLSGATRWINASGGYWNVAANWSAGVPDISSTASIDAPGRYVVAAAGNVDITRLVVDADATVSLGAGSSFVVEGDATNDGNVKLGSFSGERVAAADFKGDVRGSGDFAISDKATLEIGGAVSGQVLSGSFSGITVSFETDAGNLILDHSTQFHGLIGSSSPDRPLSAGNLIDLRDLSFTSTMSASVHYDSSSNISTVDFGNGADNVTLLFSGNDPNWTFASDGQGGTVVADPTNPIVLENQKQGTPQSVWQIAAGADSTKIQGFTTAISTNVGSTVQFKINNQTGAPNYHIDIYRLGYYGGNGARLITSLQHQAAASVIQPAPLKDTSTGLVDAGNWSVTDSWTVPTTAVSGVYIANVIDGTQVFQIPFVVRSDASTSAIVFQTSDQTWEAYNPWGGADLYAGNGPGINGSAYAVSYNRPITTRDGGLFGTSNDMVFSAEYPAIYWLEQNGYDVSYISGIDAATSGSLLLNHQVYMDVGHDEYWTDSQVSNVQAAGHAGTNLMFLSGNEVYWQTRLAASIDPSHTANRTLITYKDTHANQLIDPTGTATSTFMDARFASTGGMAGIPSNALTGTVFQVDSDRTDVIKIPYGMTKLRFWRNTSVANTPPGQSASLVQNLLGYEWDSSPDNGFRPAGLVDVSSTTLQINGQYLLDYGNTTGNGTATHNLVEFRDPVSGALVFGAGTVFWSWGLASDHDQVTGSATPIDPNVQQATVNVLADMGVQPATLQASLVIASQSSDHTAPTSTITNVSASSVPESQSVTVTGTASDVGGVIGGVEVSTDSGKTWHPATSGFGTANVTWSYTFTAGASGQYKIESRAVDDSVNLETPAAGVGYTVTPSTNLSMFSPTDTPAVITTNDPGAAELGVKFVAAVSGDITGIRFYKGPQNTGTHLGDLWTTNGALLASATFTNETASGWQQVNFATPVHVQAGLTYVASYHTNTGQYSTTDFYFDNAGHTRGPLTATGSGLNGVYAYGPGPLFPNTVSNIKADNYWVDVVFRDTTLQPQANNDSGFNVAENGVLSIPASALLANDTDPAGLSFSITSVSSPVNGSVSYNAQTQTVTFTPTANFAGPAQFSYTITDTSEASGTGQVSLNVNYPVSAQSLFATTDTPSVVNSGDTSSVEVGVKFSASVNGTITGLRFYKGSLNTGTHVAHLWTATGTLLGTATFSAETASGWQQVSFSSPIAVTAGTTYVASYHTNGNYSDTQSYFTNSITNGQLSAPAAGNGVYAYGSGAPFPTNVYKSSNYYVDVVFNGSSNTNAPPTAVADTGDATEKGGLANGTGGSPATGNVLTNDTDPDAGDTKTVTAVAFGSTAGTLGSTLNGAHGGLVLNATGAFTYTVNETDPAVQALRLATNTVTDVFNYTMRDAAGATSSTTLTITVHGANDAPVLAVQTGNQTATVGSAFSLTLPAGTFTDVDSGDSLAYTATAADGSPLPGWLSFNATTRTFSGTPASGDVGTVSVKATATDLGSLAASETFNVAVSTAPSTVSLFSSSDTPSVLSTSDTSQVNLGVRFTSSAAGTISAIKYYKSANDTGTHAGSLWSSTGTLLATATFSNETSSGWQTVTFSSPVSIAAGTTYVASFHSNGHYADTPNYFATAHANGPLTAAASNNGVYSYGTGNLFPTSTFSATNYWVDVVFNNSTGGTNQPPIANNDSGFNATENVPLSISGSTLLANDTDSNGDALTITGVSGAVNGTVGFSSQNNTVTFTPVNGYTGPASFNYVIADGRGGTASARADVTVHAPSASTVSLFSANPTPSVVTVNDPNSVELGMKFQASTSGDIVGVRFYKGPSNTGTHVADLWSSTGSLLATATFSNETASGWQQVNFATPVTITAGTTYIASYHTAGNYSDDPNLFANAVTNGPLTAPSSSSSGGNGVYAYGSGSLFPSNTFNATSYAVDVVFRAQLAA